MPSLRSLLLAATASAALAAPATAAAVTRAGAFDPTWSGDGLSTVDTGPGLAAATALDRLPDGRVVAAGSWQDATSGSNEAKAVVAIFRADGSPDPAFGTGGRVLLSLGGAGAVHAVRALDDGRIVAFGYGTFGGATRAFAWRLQPDGQGDGANGSDGGVTGMNHIEVPGGDSDVISASTVDPQGRPVLVGMTTRGTGVNGLVMRFTPSGALDTQFGGDGIHVLSLVDGGDTQLDAVAVASTTRIVVAGHRPVNDHTTVVAKVVASHIPGLDTTFGIGGRIQVGDPSTSTTASAVAVLPDGRVRVGGHGAGQAVLFGLTAAGQPDLDFGTDGRLAPTVPGGGTTAVDTLTNGPGDALYVSDARYGGVTDVASTLRRMRPDGSFDAAFAAATTKAVSPFAVLKTVRLDGNDLLAGGMAGTDISRGDLAVARVVGAERPDPPQPEQPQTPPAQQPQTPPVQEPQMPPVNTPRAAIRARDVIRVRFGNRCAKRQRATLTLLAPRGATIRSATLRLSDGRVTRLRGTKLRGRAIRLVGVRGKRLRVRVAVTLSTGQRLALTSRIKRCAR